MSGKYVKTKLLILGQLPPPIIGEALAVKMIVSSYQFNKKYSIKVLNKSYRGKNVGAVWANGVIIIKYILTLLWFRPQIIYTTLGQKVGGILRDFIFVSMASFVGIPVIGHLHGGAFRARFKNSSYFLRFLMKLYINRLRLGVVLGERLRDQFSGLLADDRVRIVKNAGWSENEIVISEVVRQKQRGENIHLLFLSNVLPAKGFFDVLSALVIIKKKGIPFRFTFAGAFFASEGYTSEELRSKTENIIRDNGLAADVEIVGVVTDEDKWRLFRRADIFLLPSYYAFEGQPISIIEAMSAGCAIITTDYRGIPDLVKNGRNGWFVPPHSPAAIAERIEWIWNHRDWLLATSERNILKAKEEFTPEIYIEKIIQLLENTLGRKASLQKGKSETNHLEL